MCGRFTQTSDAATIASRFRAVATRAEVVPRYNIAPTDPVVVIVREGGAPAIELFRWGLIPWWATSMKVQPQPINAKAETLATSSLFKRLLPTRRCLVVADGFYEWSVGREKKPQRRPFRVCLRSRGPFAFAGLWDLWSEPAKPQAPALRTCTIVTIDANSLVAPIHDRMPAILTPDQEARWIDPALKDPAELKTLLAPLAPEAMELYPVSPLVNDVKNQGPELILPFTG